MQSEGRAWCRRCIVSINFRFLRSGLFMVGQWIIRWIRYSWIYTASCIFSYLRFGDSKSKANQFQSNCLSRCVWCLLFPARRFGIERYKTIFALESQFFKFLVHSTSFGSLRNCKLQLSHITFLRIHHFLKSFRFSIRSSLFSNCGPLGILNLCLYYINVFAFFNFYFPSKISYCASSQLP